jgi:hypothetical protein
MTQEQALAELKLIFPDDAEYLRVEREHSIGCRHGFKDTFTLWNHSAHFNSHIVASSNRSWEHALAIAKSGNEECWEQDTSEVEL